MKLLHPIRLIEDLLITLHRVFYWLPVIWKDQWWDSCFLLRIMEHKLRYDSKHYLNGVACGCERRSKQMLTSAWLCKRLSDGNYTTPWAKEAEEGARRFFNYLSTNRCELPSGMSYFSSKGYQPDPRLEKMARWHHERLEELQERDLEQLTEIFKKHMFGWWD